MIARVPQEVLSPRTDEMAEKALSELCLLAFGHSGEENTLGLSPAIFTPTSERMR